MKNVIKFLAVAVIFMTTATMQAQDKPACCAKKAEKKVEMLKEKLSLSDEQVEKVTVLVGNPTGDFEMQIKEILTPEQYATYQELPKGKSCCAKKGDKKACDKGAEKKACCKKGDKKACDKKAEKKACCKKDGKKKSCCKKK